MEQKKDFAVAFQTNIVIWNLKGNRLSFLFYCIAKRQFNNTWIIKREEKSFPIITVLKFVIFRTESMFKTIKEYQYKQYYSNYCTVTIWSIWIRDFGHSKSFDYQVISRFKKVLSIDLLNCFFLNVNKIR